MPRASFSGFNNSLGTNSLTADGFSGSMAAMNCRIPTSSSLDRGRSASVCVHLSGQFATPHPPTVCYTPGAWGRADGQR
jgi:hypothetical protein